MNYSIVFSSPTGNTAELAETIKAALPQESCRYFGEPNISAADTPLVFVGFWTDKGACNSEIASFLKDIKQKKVFLFGTAGFGGSAEYFNRILASAKSSLDGSNEIVGSFMCQGKMPVSVRDRYSKMLTGGEGDVKVMGMLENFDRASEHPNLHDREQLKQAVSEVTGKL